MIIKWWIRQFIIHSEVLTFVVNTKICHSFQQPPKHYLTFHVCGMVLFQKSDWSHKYKRIEIVGNHGRIPSIVTTSDGKKFKILVDTTWKKWTKVVKISVWESFIQFQSLWCNTQTTNYKEQDLLTNDKQPNTTVDTGSSKVHWLYRPTGNTCTEPK